MKQIMKPFILSCLLFCGIAYHAIADTPTPDNRKIYTFFVNGIDTDKPHALEDMDHVQTASAIKTNMFDTSNPRDNNSFHLLWNAPPESGGGFFTEVGYVMDQRANGKYPNCGATDKTCPSREVNADDLTVAAIKYQFDIKAIPVDCSGDPTSQCYIDIKKNLVQEYESAPEYKYGINNIKIITQMEAQPQSPPSIAVANFLFKAGGTPYVFLIGHSQGDLYVNTLRRYLNADPVPLKLCDDSKPPICKISPIKIPDAHIATFEIANPSPHYQLDDHLVASMAKLFPNPLPPYLTDNGDHVIAATNVLMWFGDLPHITLPSNTTLGSFWGSLSKAKSWGHNLINYYLNDKDEKPLSDEVSLGLYQNFVYLKMTLEDDSYKNDNAILYWEANFDGTTTGVAGPDRQRICSGGGSDDQCVNPPAPALPNAYYLYSQRFRKSTTFMGHTAWYDSRVLIPIRTNKLGLQNNYYIYGTVGPITETTHAIPIICVGKKYATGLIWGGPLSQHPQQKQYVYAGTTPSAGCYLVDQYNNPWNHYKYFRGNPELTADSSMFIYTWVFGTNS